MPKIEKSDIEKAYGLPNFLIPLEVLPEYVSLKGKGAYVGLTVTGTVRKIEDQLFLQVERWKMK